MKARGKRIGMASTFYEILGVSKHATDAEIKKAFKELAKKYHPDKHPGQTFYEEHFKKINEAHQTLSDPKARKVYDLKLFYAYNPPPQQNQQPNYKKQPYQQHRQSHSQPNYKKASSSNAQARAKEAKQKLNVYYLYVGLIAVVFIFGCYWFYNFMNAYSSKEYFTEGLKEELNGNQAKAMGYYFSALEKNMESPEVNEKIGDVYTKLAHNNSLELFYYDLELQQKDINPHFDATSKNLLMQMQGIDSLANMYYERAFQNYELNADKRRVGFKSIKSSLKIGDYKSARHHINAIGIYPDTEDDDSVYYYLGEMNFYKKEYPEARKYFEMFSRRHPQSSESTIRIALCHYNEFNEDYALEELAMTIMKFPQQGEAYYFLGEIKRRNKDSLHSCALFYKADSLHVLAAKSAIYSYCRN